MRIAIVNDLALAREALRRLVTSVPAYSVAWTAVDGAEAVCRAAEDRPDVILMDLVMPVMDGVEATRRIMEGNPCPILLVTSSVTGNFNMVYRAMGHGGLDAVNTPVLGPDGKIKDSEGLLARLDKLDQANRLHGKLHSATTVLQNIAVQGSGKSAAAALSLPPLLLLGASTGGPEALAQILGEFPADFPAGVVVIQHIAADFAPSLVVWLQARTNLRISAAAVGSEPKPGHVLVAATNDHLVLRPDRRLAYAAEPVELPYRPSVDVFFASVVSAWPRPGVAALLTGMGSDGARGLLLLRKAGWQTITQDQAGCIVYGMPKAAAELNAACRILPLNRIANAILSEMPKLLR
jgi:two-component system response regulator WspF